MTLADTTGMLLSNSQLLAENPSWRLVLQAYRTKTIEAAEERAVERMRAKAAAKQSAEQAEGESETDEELSDAEDDSNPVTEDRWLSRIQGVEGIDADELSRVHGHLIAHGFIKFQLSGRDGLAYQLTTLGHRGAEPADDNDQDVAEDSLEDAA